MRGSLLLTSAAPTRRMPSTRSSWTASSTSACGSWPARGSATPTSARASSTEAQAAFAKLGDGRRRRLGAFYKDRALYHQARIAELQGNPAEATRTLSRGAGQEPHHLAARRDHESPRRARAEVTRRTRSRLVALASAAALAAAGCAGRDRAPPRRRRGARRTRAGVLQIAWRTTLHEHGLFEPAPEECASGVLARRAAGDRLARRQRRRRRARTRATSTGSTPVVGRHRQRGPLRCGARPGLRRRRRRQLLRRRPQGRRHPLDLPRQGRHRARRPRSAPTWSTSATRRRPRGRARGRHRQMALAVRARDARGVHHPRLRGPAPARPRSCWPASPTATSSRWQRPRGEVLWARSLAAASDQFVDVDSTPGADRRRRLRVLLLGRALRARPARRRRALAPRHRGRRRRHRRAATASTSRRRARGCTPPIPTGTSSGARG